MIRSIVQCDVPYNATHCKETTGVQTEEQFLDPVLINLEGRGPIVVQGRINAIEIGGARATMVMTRASYIILVGEDLEVHPPGETADGKQASWCIRILIFPQAQSYLGSLRDYGVTTSDDV
jgi:hypothetical protein